jgi:hypothetical protein
LVQRLEELPAGATEVFHGPLVELVEQLTDGLVQVGESEEGAIPQAGEDPTLDHLDTDLHLGVIFGLVRACRNDGRAIVLRQVVVGGIQVWFVAAGVFDTRFEIVGHDDLGHPADEGEGAHVCAGPVG